MKTSKTYTIRSYECDRNNNLRILTLLNIFQDMADNDAASRGFGLDFCIQNGMTWVGSNYIIEISRLPKIHETIRIDTWPSASNKLTAYRDFEIFGEDGASIVRATSQWLLLSLERRRPISVIEHMPVHKVVPERVIETDFPKIEEISGETEEFHFRVRFDDIDLNKHINNAVYALWASESVPADFRLLHNPKKISINFRKEGFMGENVTVLTHLSGQISAHTIRTFGSDNDRELARILIDWA